ncbi:MAG: hypothetical protein COB08_001815 [Rhodobacteraceae bacterium]|nr:hypothetical protein [Paracoccaceae bacterium]
MKVLALILALTPSALLAQNLPERLANAPSISLEDWRAMTEGKTVVYEIDGVTYGYESYLGANKVTIRLDDGSCIDGTWHMEQTAFCFDWQGSALNCFNHKRLDGNIYVVGLENGVETTDIQRVSRITNIPVACGPALLSSLITPVHP